MLGCLKINPQGMKTIQLVEEILLYSCYPVKKDAVQTTPLILDKGL